MQNQIEHLEILPSVRLIKRFLNLQGQENRSKVRAKNLKESIKNAISKGRIVKSDKYFDKLEAIIKKLDEFIKGNDKILHLQEENLSGLKGIPGVNIGEKKKFVRMQSLKKLLPKKKKQLVKRAKVYNQNQIS
eukprot:TRINITY_DN1923_c0_g1_i3.p1 TRINITY_DN1923_c0_g1~~TRINITY_DN1923_c0_g1_i3.p1  ORF type:complete len:133 (-),score=5.43 TRINITY_DN1923_c0_g1_i3:227-625(-)